MKQAMEQTTTEKPLPAAKSPITSADVALWSAFGSGVAVIFSIAISQILLGIALYCMIQGRIRMRFPRTTLPLALFLLGTLIAFAFSEVPSAGLSQLKHMYIYLTLPVIFTNLRTTDRASKYFMAVAGATALMAIMGCGQFVQKLHAAQVAGKSFYEFYLEARISGLQKHWMAFSGQELYGLLIAGAWLFFAPRPKRWTPRMWSAIGLLCGGLICLALLLSETRSIWIAAFFAGVYLLWFRSRLFAILAPVIVAIGVLFARAAIEERVVSIVYPHGYTDSNAHRLVCWRTGIAMIKAHPLLGLGPDVQKLKFYDYVPSDIPWPLPTGFYGHLHNIYIQYAADRGILTMLMLVWFLVQIMVEAWRKLKTLPSGRSDSRFVLHAAIACTIGSMIAGVFEYNLNTSVVLALFLAIAACSAIASENRIEPVASTLP
jgi:putative inorganic carbon (HCO3(-)) transporter